MPLAVSLEEKTRTISGGWWLMYVVIMLLLLLLCTVAHCT
jgi:hypothetical protein